MERKKLLIFPFNGNGVEALDCLDENEFEFLGFIDDDPLKLSLKQSYPVFTRQVLESYPDALVLAVPGSPTSFLIRKKIIDSLGLPEERFVTIIHPKASIGKQVKIGRNCLIMAGVVLTSNVDVQDHVCILPNTVVHHDAVIGQHTLIGSNVAIAGSVKIGENCYVGSGANIINNITIGKCSLIGLGSNVLKSFPESSKAAGNPARNIS